MRKLFLAIAVIGLMTVLGRADDPKAVKDAKALIPPANPSVSLKVGDPAPPLTASEWLQGEPIRQFEPGKIYVVEFWATWCGPCILMMPHTAELQTQYKDQGVTVIAYTGRDPDNTREKVVEFVKKRGQKLPYTFAYNDQEETTAGWMKSAGRAGIPCAFVVDKAGRIAFIGHAMDLGVVIPRVIAGESPQVVSDATAIIHQEWVAAISMSDDLFDFRIKASIRALKEFEARYSSLANNPFSLRFKLSNLPRVGDIEEMKKVANQAVARAIAQDDSTILRMVFTILRDGPGKESKELLAVAVKAAEANVRLAGDKDVRARIDLARTYAAAGDMARARERAGEVGKAVGDKDADTLIDLANVYVAIGAGSEAKKLALEAALQVGDRPRWRLINLAKVFVAIGARDEAREYARRAEKNPGDIIPIDLINLAGIYFAIGDQAEASKYFRRAEKVFGDRDVKELVWLATECCSIGDTDDAKAYARRAGLLASDKNAEDLLRMASIYFTIGDKAEAGRYARKAIAAASGADVVLKQNIEQAARKFEAVK